MTSTVLPSAVAAPLSCTTNSTLSSQKNSSSGGFLRRQINRFAPTIVTVMRDRIFPKHPDLSRLAKVNGELNDDIITRYGELLVKKSRHRIFLFDSLRWAHEVEQHSEQCTPKQWQILRRWFHSQKAAFAKKPKLKERLETMCIARYIFIPINDCENHWILGVIDNQKREISIYDSLNGEHHDETLKRLKIFAKAFLCKDASWVCMLVPVHSQGLTLNCGVHVCIFMRSLAHATHQQMDFTQQDIPHLRALIGFELVQGNVNIVGL